MAPRAHAPGGAPKLYAEGGWKSVAAWTYPSEQTKLEYVTAGEVDVPESDSSSDEMGPVLGGPVSE